MMVGVEVVVGGGGATGIKPLSICFPLKGTMCGMWGISLIPESSRCGSQCRGVGGEKGGWCWGEGGALTFWEQPSYLKLDTGRPPCCGKAGRTKIHSTGKGGTQPPPLPPPPTFPTCSSATPCPAKVAPVAVAAPTRTGIHLRRFIKSSRTLHLFPAIFT